MELVILTKAILSLIIVVILLYILLKIIQKNTHLGFKNIQDTNNVSNLRLVNIIYIDDVNKIVVFKSSDYKTYILAVNKNNVVLIDKKTNQTEESKNA